MNKPREGNIPGHPTHYERDAPDTRHSTERKVESGLAEPRRRTAWNWHSAQKNGWTAEQFDHWCNTGEVPFIHQVRLPPEVEKRAAEIFNRDFDEDDERLKR
jgi:hypothetical protein